MLHIVSLLSKLLKLSYFGVRVKKKKVIIDTYHIETTNLASSWLRTVNELAGGYRYRSRACVADLCTLLINQKAKS